jgi:hypothetical protein
MHAILGWGLLIWDVSAFPIKLRDPKNPWKPGGPALPLEFSRISATRTGALTIVVDQAAGARCEVWYAISERNRQEDAICDLRSREGTTLANISYVTVGGRAHSDLSEDILNSIEAWAREHGLFSVAWTGLRPNFSDKIGKPFTAENALAYLTDLKGRALSEALEYLHRAPASIDTPLRRLVKQSTWWKINQSSNERGSRNSITTIRGPSDLLNKLIRTQHRAWHAQHSVHVADHLYDFCVTALALRDHVFVHQNLSEPEKKRFHNEWANDPNWAACRDIANAFKHLELRQGASVGALKHTRVEAVDIYQSTEGTLQRRLVQRPDIEIVWPEDQRTITVLDLTSNIIKRWMTYFDEHGIALNQQDEAEFFGVGASET